MGEAQFDLAKYGATFAVTEHLPLIDCVYDGAYIEISIKTKLLDGAPQTPSNISSIKHMNNSMNNLSTR